MNLRRQAAVSSIGLPRMDAHLVPEIVAMARIDGILGKLFDDRQSAGQRADGFEPAQGPEQRSELDGFQGDAASLWFGRSEQVMPPAATSGETEISFVCVFSLLRRLAWSSRGR